MLQAALVLAAIHAIILLLVVEGICFALFPRLMRKAMFEAATMPDQALRAVGCFALASAILLGFALRLLT